MRPLVPTERTSGSPQRVALAGSLLILALAVAASTPMSARADPYSNTAKSSFPRPATATDVSARFANVLTQGQLNRAKVDLAFEQVRRHLDGVKVVIVPSYLVDFIAAGRDVGLIDYFSDQQAWLRSIGVETVMAPVDTEATVAANGARLAAFARESDKPLCLLSHSKGGLDTLEALIRLRPEERRSVRCWIALQAPFAGSPIADLAANSGIGRAFIDFTLSLAGGSPRSLDNMTTSARRDYLAAADADIRELAETIPILSVTSRLRAPASAADVTPFEWPRGLMAAEGIESDGVVPTSSAILPYARFVVIDDLDHGDTIDAGCWPSCGVDDDVALLKALFALALDPAAVPAAANWRMMEGLSTGGTGQDR